MLDTSQAQTTSGRRALTFIEVTEVWTPDQSGERLTLESGIYGRLDEFAKASHTRSFVRDEGLPGKAWANASPVVLKDLRDSYFKRTEAAEAAGLTTAVAIPTFAGSKLKGVTVFLCADDSERTGAIEIWQEGRGGTGILDLVDGYYGAARHFEWISRHTQFPRGQGLPGGVWAAGAAMLLRDLGSSHRFIRAESAGTAGLTTGLGLPVEVPGGSPFVLTLLSARGTPLARRFEIWNVTGSDHRKATLIDGLCEIEGALWESERQIEAWQGPIGRVAATATPLATTIAEGDAALPAGFDAVVAMPVHKAGRLTQIAAWYF